MDYIKKTNNVINQIKNGDYDCIFSKYGYDWRDMNGIERKIESVFNQMNEYLEKEIGDFINVKNFNSHLILSNETKYFNDKHYYGDGVISYSETIFSKDLEKDIIYCVHHLNIINGEIKNKNLVHKIYINKDIKWV